MPNWKKVVTSGSNADLNTLNVTSTGAFGGSLTVTNTSGDTLTLTKDTTEPSLRMEGDTDKDFVLNIQGEVFNISQNDGTTDIFSLDHDTKNATFAGNITVSSSTNRSIILDYTSGIGNYTWMSFKQSGTEQFRVWGSYADNYLSFYNDQASLHQLKLNSDGTTTFAGNVLLENATSSKPVLTLKNTNTDAEGAVINLIKDSSSPSDNDEVGSIYMRGDNDNEEEIEAIWIRGYMTDVSDSDEDSRLRFYTYKSGTQTNTLDLESGNAMFSGNVGIGTTSPSEKLVVQDGKVLAGHTDTKGYGFHDLSNYSYTANTGRLSLVTNGTEAVSIDSSQNVGIGTTSPGSRLEISGGSLPSGGLTDLGISTGLTTGRSGTYETNTLTTLNVRGDTASYELLAGSTSAKYSGIAATAADASSFSGTLQLFTAGEAQLFIDASGNIGVGTSAPSNFYSNARNIVIRGSDNTGITISSGATSSGRLVFNDGVDQNVEGEIKYDHSNESMAFTANSSEAMRIINGNLGVGIESPDSRIHSEIAAAALNPTNLDDNTVVGLSVTIPDASLSGGEGQAIALGMNGRGRSYIANQFASVNKDASDLLFYTETGGIIYDRMKIDQDGDIDITSGSLNLEGNLLPTTNITSNVGSSSKYFLNLYAYALQSGGDLQFKTNGDNERLRIDSNGNVGIGTTSPSSHLHIFQDDTSTNEILLENAGTGDVALSFRSDANTDGSNFASIYFDANDEGDNNTRYAKIRAFIEDNAAGAEDGKLVFTTLVGNSDTNHLVFDSAGSTFDSNITLSGTNDITVTGGTIYGNNLQAITSAGLKVGNDDFSGFVQVQDNGQVNLDSGNGEIHLKGSSSTFGKFFKSSDNFFINHPTANKSILFTGTSGSSSTTALTLDMADESATFKRKIQIGESLDDDPTILFQTDGNSMTMGIDRSDSNTFKISDNTSLAAPDRFSISTAGVITFNSAYTFPTSDGSANQVLKTDGAGNLSFTSAGSGTVDGSGTANDVAMWSDSNTLTDAPIAISSNDATFAGQVLCDTNTTTPTSGDAAFYKSSTGAVLSGYQAILETGAAGSRNTAITVDNNQRVGIGTTSPTFPLDIEHSSEDILRLHNTTDGLDSLIKFSNAGGTLARVQGIDNGGLSLETGDNAGGINVAMRIDNVGNVSINNDDVAFPSGKGLQIYNSGNPRLKLANATTGTGSLDGTQIYMDGADIIYDQKDSGNQRFYTGGSERVRIESDGTVQITNSTSPKLQLKRGTEEYTIRQDNNNKFVIQEEGGNEFFVVESGASSNSIRIDNSGNVGIGTTSPGAKFNVFTGGNSIAAAAVLQHDSFDTDRKVGLGFELGSTQIKGAIGFMSDDDTSSQSNGIGNLIFCVDSNDDASPVSHNDEIMRITHTGNVGIGTTTPNPFSWGQRHLTLTKSGTNQFVAVDVIGTGNGGGAINFGGGDGSGTASDILRANINAVDGSHFVINTNNSNSGTSLTERFRITNAGNVGIGTTSPNQKLEVAGRLRVTTDPTFEAYEASDKRGGIQWDATNDLTNIFSVGGPIRFFITDEKMRINTDGNVGIGTSTPSGSLTIGDISTGALPQSTGRKVAIVGNGGDNNDGLIITRDNGSQNQLDQFTNIYNDGTSTFMSSGGTSTHGTYDFRSTNDAGGSSTSRLNISQTGLVGIGKSATTWSLSVKNSSDVHIASFEGSNNTGVTINSEDSTAAAIIGRAKDNSAAYNDLDIRGNTTAGSGIYIDGSESRVGIGTTTPEKQLHILSSTTDATPQLLIQNSSTGDANLTFNISGDSYSVGIDNSDNDTFKISAGDLGVNDRFAIDSSGNIGIGTSSPSEALEISGGHLKVNNAGNTSLKLNANAADSDASIFFEEADATKATIKHDASNDALSLTDGTDTELMVLKGGNVGIGTTSPDSQLHVVGNTHIYNAANLGMDAAGAGQLKVTGGATSQYSFVVSVDDAGTYLYNNGGSRNIIIGLNEVERFKLSSGGALTINQAYTFPTADGSANQVLQTDGAGNLSFAAAGGSGIDGSGTANSLPKFSDSDTVTDSTITDDGDEIEMGVNVSIERTHNFTSNAYQNTKSGDEANIVTQNTYSGFGDLENYFNSVNSVNGSKFISFALGATEKGFIDLQNSSTVRYSTSSSDIRKKKNIEDWTENVLDLFRNTTPKLFNFVDEDNSVSKTKGFIAQSETEKFPEAYGKGYQLGDDDGYYSFNPSGMVPYLMKAIKELAEENDTLNNKLNALTARIEALENE